jgi:hypothetical protein
MRNEKEKLFSRYLPEKKAPTSMFASHIKFIFLFAFFQTIKHFSLLSFSLVGEN